MSEKCYELYQRRKSLGVIRISKDGLSIKLDLDGGLRLVELDSEQNAEVDEQIKRLRRQKQDYM